jgi:hypothetical protein
MASYARRPVPSKLPESFAPNAAVTPSGGLSRVTAPTPKSAVQPCEPAA